MEKKNLCGKHSDPASAKALQCVLHCTFLNRHLMLAHHISEGSWILPVSRAHVVYGLHTTIHQFFFSSAICCNAYGSSDILPQPLWKYWPRNFQLTTTSNCSYIRKLGICLKNQLMNEIALKQGAYCFPRNRHVDYRAFFGRFLHRPLWWSAHWPQAQMPHALEQCWCIYMGCLSSSSCAHCFCYHLPKQENELSNGIRLEQTLVFR